MTRVLAAAIGSGPSDDDADRPSSIPQGLPRHIALVRAPRMVVKYLEFPTPGDGAGFVGVFVGDDEMNAVFADAEPVTHDEWNPESLEDKWHRTFVRVGLKRISEHVRDYIQPTGASSSDASDVPLGALSRFLGALVATAPGTGAEGQPVGGGDGGGGGGGGGGATRLRLEMSPSVELSQRRGDTVARFSMQIKGLDEPHRIRLAVRPYALTADGGAEAESPVGMAAPEVVAWSSDQTAINGSAREVELFARNNDSVFVFVSVPNNTAVTLDASVRLGRT